MLRGLFLGVVVGLIAGGAFIAWGGGPTAQPTPPPMQGYFSPSAPYGVPASATPAPAHSPNPYASGPPSQPTPGAVLPQMYPGANAYQSQPYPPGVHPPVPTAMARPDKKHVGVYEANYLPAVDLAEILRDAIGKEGPKSAEVVVVADSVSNAVIVSGTQEQVQAAKSLFEQLDVAPKQVAVEAALVKTTLTEDQIEAILGDYVQGEAGAASEISLEELLDAVGQSDGESKGEILSVTALDNQSAFVQFGGRVPRTKGSSTTMENVGRILAVTARVHEEGVITMELDVESSEPAKDDESISVFTAQTTVSVKSGEVIRLGGVTQMGKAGDKVAGIETMILLRAVIVE